MPRKKLANYFDRVVLINLKRRPDRLKRTQEALKECRWPFKWPEVVEAVDGYANPVPAHFTNGPGAWGCMLTHKGILEQAIADRVRNVLILEDDICFIGHFRELIEEFLELVPGDWEQLMIGGQHMLFTGKPELIKPGVFRCIGTERTHCYAVRGEYMTRLIEKWTGGGKFNGNGHCDWIMGRDPDLQPKHKVYAPEFFLAGQERSKSDINGRVTPRQFWNPPGPELSVINLHAPKAVVIALREYGFHIGYDRERLSGVDNGLIKVFSANGGNPDGREHRMREWIKVIQWEVASDPRLLCTVWHPLAEPALVKEASLWPVYEITADTVEDVLKQLPGELRRQRMPELVEEGFASPNYNDRTPLPQPVSPGGVPLVRPSVPTKKELATNFSKAMLGWAKAGFKVVKRKVYEQRHAICSACEHWRADARMGTGMCLKCGCSGVKLWLAPSTCPDQPPRWGGTDELMNLSVQEQKTNAGIPPK